MRFPTPKSRNKRKNRKKHDKETPSPEAGLSQTKSEPRELTEQTRHDLVRDLVLSAVELSRNGLSVDVNIRAFPVPGPKDPPCLTDSILRTNAHENYKPEKALILCAELKQRLDAVYLDLVNATLKKKNEEKQERHTDEKLP